MIPRYALRHHFVLSHNYIINEGNNLAKSIKSLQSLHTETKVLGTDHSHFVHND